MKSGRNMDTSLSIANIIKERSTKKENLLQKIMYYLDSLNGRIREYSIDIMFKKSPGDYETQSDGKMAEHAESTICLSSIQSCTVVIHINWSTTGLQKYTVMNIESQNYSDYGIN